MYTEYFGLQQEPFRSTSRGPGVYAGAGQTTAISRLQKALGTSDACAAVTGPVGVGKTTVVYRALEVIAPDGRVARIGRMRLGPDEVLELLLDQFGISRQPVGTIQRFAAFKRLLADCAANKTRAIIVVEDACRIGADALMELEAMTAADGSESGTANIVLMGDPGLPGVLADPALARLQQRMRTRQTILPFTEAELHDYLKHCMHLAGGDFDAIFAGGSVATLHHCSDGIPRIVNNICESALIEAADENADTISVALLRRVALDVYGIDSRPGESATAVDVETRLHSNDANTQSGVPDAVSLDEEDELKVSVFTPEPDLTVIDRTGNAPKASFDVEASRAAPITEPAIDHKLAAHDKTGSDDTLQDLPDASELFEDMPGESGEPPPRTTLQVVPVESGIAATLDAAAEEAPAEISLELEAPEENTPVRDDDIPVLTPSMRVGAPANEAVIAPVCDESAIATLTPESEELISALDELERAISSANEADEPTGNAADESPQLTPPEASLPEITLDRHIASPAEPKNDMSKWQEELAKAHSLEEMSDLLAETVFGDESFDLLAAGIANNPPADPTPVSEALGLPAAIEPDAIEPEPEVTRTVAATPGPQSTDNNGQGGTGGFDLSMSKRFALLKALGDAESPAKQTDEDVLEITLGEDRPAAPCAPQSAPEPIESQIDTAITQSRMRLTAADVASMDNDSEQPEPDTEKTSTGLFGLFKRSSK